jgi:Fe-S cluster assembly protein SufD
MSLAEAIRTGDLTELPSRRDEAWRWTDLRGLLRVLPPKSVAADESFNGPFDKIKGSTLDVINGGGGEIVVAAGDNETWRVVFGANAEAGAHLNTLRVEVGEGASLLLLETYLGDDVGYVADTKLDVHLADDAGLERVVIAEDGEGAVSVSIADVALAARSRFAQTVLTTGAKRQRLETRIAHPGAGATVRMDGVYLLGAKRHADITTVVDHVGPGGDTDQMIKGVVSDQSRGVFQGRIVVAHGADQTNARMKHDALILSDQAEVDAKPELEIYADDVACAHGNTVGALDAEALFYAAQRGIPEAAARAMLTRAFVETVVDRIEHDAAREVARGWIAAKLGAAT